MNIWAHRGCSQRYPENTLLAFENAARLNGLTGIELDIQLTRDGELVVIHDERVDRTTEGIGYVRDYTLSGLKRLHIYAGNKQSQSVPTIEEVFDMLERRLKAGMKLNIELKNSIYPYCGMEERILDIVQRRGLQDNITYSSFYALSLKKLRLLEPTAQTGILDNKVSDCFFKRTGCGADALHPFWRGMDLSGEDVAGLTVRAWMSGHLFPEQPTGKILDLALLEAQGITDIILNEPECYL